MKPVEQTICTVPGGNCFPACLASILEIGIDEIPNEQGDDWHSRYEDFLRPMGLGMVSLAAMDGQGNLWKPKGYSILAAVSPRFAPHLHAVVCYDGEVVFDPSPKREAGLGEWKEFSIFTCLDPGEMAVEVAK